MKTINKIIVLLGLSLALFESSSAFALPFIGKGKGQKQVDAQYGRGHDVTKSITEDLIELALIAQFRDLITEDNENNQYNGTLQMLRAYFNAHNDREYNAGNQYGVQYYPFLRELPNNTNLQAFTEEVTWVRAMYGKLRVEQILNLLRNYFREDSYDNFILGQNIDYYMQAAIRRILDFVVYRNDLDDAPEIDEATQDALVGLLRQAANDIFGQLDLAHRIAPGAFTLEEPAEYFGENPGQVTYPRAGRFFGTTPSDTNINAFNAAVRVLFLAEYAQIFGAFTPSTYGNMFRQVRDNLRNLRTTTVRSNLLTFILIGGNREYQVTHPIVDHLNYWAETGLNYTGVDVEPTEYGVNQGMRYNGDDEEAHIFITDENIARIAQAIANTFDRQFIQDNIVNALESMHEFGFDQLTQTEQAEAVVALNRTLHRFTPDNPGFEYFEDEGNPLDEAFGDLNIDLFGDEDAENMDEEKADEEPKRKEKKEDTDNESDGSDTEDEQDDFKPEQEKKEEKEKSPKQVRKVPSFSDENPANGRRSAPTSPQTRKRKPASLKRQGSSPSLFNYEEPIVTGDNSLDDEEKKPAGDNKKDTVRLSQDDLENWNEELLANPVPGHGDFTGSHGDLFTMVQKETAENFHRPASPAGNPRGIQQINRLAMVTIARAAFIELLGFVNDDNANGDDVQLYIQLIQQIQKDIQQYALDGVLTDSILAADFEFNTLLTQAIQPILDTALDGTLDDDQYGHQRIEDSIEAIDSFINQAYGNNPDTLRLIIRHFTETVIREYQAALKAPEYTVERLQRLRMRLRIAINANEDYYEYRAGTRSHSTTNNVLEIEDMEASLLRVDNTVTKLTHALNAVELTLGTLTTFGEDFENMEDFSDEEVQNTIFDRIVGSVHEARNEARNEAQEARMKNLGAEINQNGENIRANILRTAKKKVEKASNHNPPGVPDAPPPPSDDWMKANTEKKSASTIKVRTRTIAGEENLTLQEMALQARLQMGSLSKKAQQIDAKKEQARKQKEEELKKQADKEAEKTGIKREGGLALNARILQAMSDENLSKEKLRELNPSLYGDMHEDGFFPDDTEWGDEVDSTDNSIETKNEDSEEEDSGDDLVKSITESVLKSGELNHNDKPEEPFSLDNELGIVGGDNDPTTEVNFSEIIVNELRAIQLNDDENFQAMAKSIKREGLEALLERSLKQIGIHDHLRMLIRSFTAEQIINFNATIPYNLWQQMFRFLSPQQIAAFNTRHGVNQRKELGDFRRMRGGDSGSEDESWDDDDASFVHGDDDDGDNEAYEAYRNPRRYREDDALTAMFRGETIGYGPDWERRLTEAYEDETMPQMLTDMRIDETAADHDDDDADAVTNDFDMTEIARGETLGYGDTAEETNTDSWEERANRYLNQVQNAATRAAITAAFAGLGHQVNKHK